MNLAILGATGATGRHVVEQALAAGHSVTAVVRDPSRLPGRAGLRLVRADLDDPAGLATAIRGSDAVICALGAPGRDRARVRERGTRSVAAAMRQEGVRRIVALSSYGVGDSRQRLPLWIRYGLVPLLLGPGFADHEAQEGFLRDSDLDWTILRPPFLTDEPGGGAVARGDDLAHTRMKIPRADVARELLAAVGDRSTIGRAVGIASAR